MESAARDNFEKGWTLGPDELVLIAAKRGGPTRLGFAILLRFFTGKGRFPDAGEVDEDAVAYVADQLGADVSAYRGYDHYGRTAEYHRPHRRVPSGADPRCAWLQARHHSGR